MNKRTLEHYRKKLLEKEKELMASYMKNKNYGRQENAEQGTQDIADRATSAYTKEFMYSLSNTDRKTIHRIQEALQRVDANTFGVCVECEDTVLKKRLDAVPWAPYCKFDEGRFRGRNLKRCRGPLCPILG